VHSGHSIILIDFLEKTGTSPESRHSVPEAGRAFVREAIVIAGDGSTLTDHSTLTHDRVAFTTERTGHGTRASVRAPRWRLEWFEWTMLAVFIAFSMWMIGPYLCTRSGSRRRIRRCEWGSGTGRED